MEPTLGSYIQIKIILKEKNAMVLKQNQTVDSAVAGSLYFLILGKCTGSLGICTFYPWDPYFP